MKRLPESRVSVLKSAARPFIDHSIEGLKTSAALDVEKSNILEVIYPSACSNDRSITSVTQVPHYKSKQVTDWLEREGDCLHCSDPLKKCVPAAKYKIDMRYWIFGQFCSTECSLGYIREHSMGPQCESWTRQMFRQCFQIFTSNVAPPRILLKRFGGHMEKKEWKSLDFIALRSPPMCTFAMFAESSKKTSSSISLRNLQRPTERDTQIAKVTPTGKEPVLLAAMSLPVQPIKETKKARMTLSTFLTE